MPARRTAEFRLLYPDEMPLVEKIETIATEVYGADGIDLAPTAAKALAEYEALGFGHLPVCMAKTHLSISHDPMLLGRPSGFRVPVRDVKLGGGAGFIYPLAGDMRTMPGLPTHPAGEKVDIDETARRSVCSRARARGSLRRSARDRRGPAPRRALR